MKKFNSIIKKIVVTVSAVAVLSGSFTACKSSSQTDTKSSETQEKKVVRIGSSGTDGTATDAALIAQRLGYFEEELEKAGYKPEYIGFTGAGPAMNEALASGSLDIALYGDLPAVTAKSSGIDVKIVATYNSNYAYAILVGKNSSISSVSGLKGKKIAVGFGTAPYGYLSRLLEKNGLSINDVEIINTSTDGPTMLASGQVDAVVSADTAVRIYESKGIGTTLISSKDDKDISGLLVTDTTSAYLNSDREAVVAVVKALNRAYEYAANNKDDALEKLVTANYNKELLSVTYSDKSFSYFNPQINDDVKSRLTSTKEFMLDNKLISGDIDIDDLIDTSVYEDAVK